MRAMHERVQLCRDPHTEFALLPRELGSQPYQPHPAGSRPHNPAGTEGCRSLRRDRAAVSRTALPGSHGGQHDTSDPQCRPVPNWVQESGRHRGCGTPGSTHCSQAAHPSDDTRCSHCWPSTDATPGNSPGPRTLKQPPPPTSAPLMMSCTFRRRARQQTKLGSNCRDRASQTRPSHPSNTQAPPLKMKTATTWTSQRPGRANSVRRSSKRSFHDSLIGLVSGV